MVQGYNVYFFTYIYINIYNTYFPPLWWFAYIYTYISWTRKYFKLFFFTLTWIMIQYLILFSFWITKHRYFLRFSSLTTCRPSKRSDLILVQNVAQYFIILQKVLQFSYFYKYIFFLDMFVINSYNCLYKNSSKKMCNVLKLILILIWQFCNFQFLRFGLKSPTRGLHPRPRRLLD